MLPKSAAPPNATMPALSATEGWFDHWLEAFGGAAGARWCSPRSDVCIPYVLATDRVGGVSIPAACSATNRHSPRFDALGEAQVDAQDIRLLMDDLSVPMLVLDYLSPDAALMQTINDASRAGLAFRVKEIALSPRVDCTGDFDDWWHSRGSHKKTWARRERRLVEREGASFEVILDPARVEAVLDEIFEVEASGWKGSQGTAIRQDPATLQFYSDLALACAQQGTLRLFVLRLDSRIVAFQFDTLFGGVLDMLKIGYRDELQKSSPGQVLQLQILRWAFDQTDVEVFDMLGGSIDPDETKLRFATHCEPLYRVRFFRRTPRGMLAWARYKALPAANARLGNMRGSVADG